MNVQNNQLNYFNKPSYSQSNNQNQYTNSCNSKGINPYHGGFSKANIINKINIKLPLVNLDSNIEYCNKLVKYKDQLNNNCSEIFNHKAVMASEALNTTYSDYKQTINNSNLDHLQNFEKIKSKILDIVNSNSKSKILNNNFKNKEDVLRSLKDNRNELLIYLFKFSFKLPSNIVYSISEFLEKSGPIKVFTFVENNRKIDNEFSLLAINNKPEILNQISDMKLNISNDMVGITPNGYFPEAYLNKNKVLITEDNQLMFHNDAIEEKIRCITKDKLKEINDFNTIINNQTIKKEIALYFITNSNLINAVENYFKWFYKSNTLNIMYVLPDLYERPFEFLFTTDVSEIFKKPKEIGFSNTKLFYQNLEFKVNLNEIKVIGALYLPQNTRIYLRYIC